MFAPGLIGIISSNWCGPSALPPLIDARPTSGFQLRSMNADANFDAAIGMRVTGNTELFRVWDTPYAPPGITKEEWDAIPLVFHLWGCGSKTQTCPALLHGVSLDDHPGITSEVEVKAEDVKSVFAGFQAGQVEGLDVTMLELGYACIACA
ncbi:hypothetical protein WJX75_003414 [Coccomyxa subellipsoidea]|uniref:Uncharacterized protein n=1 Tax=Coccomyxa subellipsoidea TaxID=248742 RepID=A0ABR2YGE6_9CHLO